MLRSRTVVDIRKRAPALSSQLGSRTHEVQRLLQRWQKYVVHAEMLVLIFYEEHPKITLYTKHIGISKRSCYLCANFIRIHGVFDVEGQHQQLYCLCTLPEEVKFRSQMQSVNFSKTLTDLQRLLKDQVAITSGPQYRPLAFLKESVANFSRATMIGRIESLENLKKDNQTIVYTSSNTSLPQLGEDADIENSIERVDSHVKLCHQDGLGKTDIRNRHKEVNKKVYSVTNIILPPLDTIVERASHPEEALVEATQAPLPKVISVTANHQKAVVEDTRK